MHCLETRASSLQNLYPPSSEQRPLLHRRSDQSWHPSQAVHNLPQSPLRRTHLQQMPQIPTKH